jgi:hypothetical protein
MRYKTVLAICAPIIFIGLLFTPYRQNIVNISRQPTSKVIALLIVIFYTEINIIYGLLALIFMLIFYRFFGEFSSANPVFTSRKVISNYSEVPLVIYQTWYTKQLPPKMKQYIEYLKHKNPEFDHYLYDDNDCRNFIKDNFDNYVLDAYDRLIPGAYKADLWRYCILYKQGGIYLDVKFYCEDGFKLIDMASDTNFVLDRPFSNNRFTITLNQEMNIINHKDYYENVYKRIDNHFWKNKKIGIYNAVMATPPNNSVLLDCIHQIVKNVNSNYYGHNPLYPTGPGLFGEKYFGNDISTKIKDFQYFNSIDGTYILNRDGKKVLSHYPGYRIEQMRYGNPSKKYYHDSWKEREIYSL